MIPKAGDVVDINPLFKKAWEAHAANWHFPTSNYGQDIDGHIHVARVIAVNMVYVIEMVGGCEYSIDGRGFPFHFSVLTSYGFLDGTPLFVPIAPAPPAELGLLDLKVANSKPDAVSCASCGGWLRSPYPGIKYCPICEP